MWNDPEEGAIDVGLSPLLLQQAAKKYSQIGTPFCLSVVKSGRLVLNEQWGFAAGDRLVETDSAAKAVTSALMGAAAEAGLLDIDTPLAHYGVKPEANWSKTGVDYFPLVTARHILMQSSGQG